MCGCVMDVGPNYVKAPFMVARACRELLEYAETADASVDRDECPQLDVCPQLAVIDAMTLHMTIPPDPVLAMRAQIDSLMPKRGSAKIEQELPALHEAFNGLGEVVCDFLTSLKNPGMESLRAAARKFLDAFEALPEESSLRGPFFR